MLVAGVCLVEDVCGRAVRYHYVDEGVGGNGVDGCASGVKAVDVAGVGEGPVLVFGGVGGGVDLGRGVALAGWSGVLWICVWRLGNKAVDMEKPLELLL